MDVERRANVVQRVSKQLEEIAYQQRISLTDSVRRRKSRRRWLWRCEEGPRKNSSWPVWPKAGHAWRPSEPTVCVTRLNVWQNWPWMHNK